MRPTWVVGRAPHEVAVLAERYAVTVVEPGQALPGGAGGHVVIAAPLTHEVMIQVRAVDPIGVAVMVEGADEVDLDAPAPDVLDALAGLGVPTLVLAPTRAETRERGQRVAAAVADSVFVLVEPRTDGTTSTPVQWVTSFFSIVDGLVDAGPVRR